MSSAQDMLLSLLNCGKLFFLDQMKIIFNSGLYNIFVNKNQSKFLKLPNLKETHCSSQLYSLIWDLV